MFDLIDECGKDLKMYGYKERKLDRFFATEFYLTVTDKNSKDIGMKKGDYYILNCPDMYDYNFDCYQYLSKRLSKQLKKVFGKYEITKSDRILLVGLGNPDISSDRLGKEVFDKTSIDPTKENNSFFKFCPNIYFSTGINTMQMVKMFTKELKIDCVLLVDSLTTKNISRLGTSFQLTSSGITPGSGVNRFGSEINEKIVGAKCFSIGVPFMIYSSSLNKNLSNEIILSPKDVRQNVEIASFVISNAINEVLR